MTHYHTAGGLRGGRAGRSAPDRVSADEHRRHRPGIVVAMVALIWAIVTLIGAVLGVVAAAASASADRPRVG
jgi:hypothetical protein